jgi:hypothetical protein
VWKKALHTQSHTLTDTHTHAHTHTHTQKQGKTVHSVYLSLVSMCSIVDTLTRKRGQVGYVAKHVLHMLKQI